MLKRERERESRERFFCVENKKKLKVYISQQSVGLSLFFEEEREREVRRIAKT